jgi:hypothetical protein
MLHTRMVGYHLTYDIKDFNMTVSDYTNLGTNNYSLNYAKKPILTRTKNKKTIPSPTQPGIP